MSWSGLRIAVPTGATRVPPACRTVVGRPSSTAAVSPSAVAVSSVSTGAHTTNGMRAAAAARASG